MLVIAHLLTFVDTASSSHNATHLRRDSGASNVVVDNTTAKDLSRKSAENSRSAREAACSCQTHKVCENEGHYDRPKVYGRHGDIHPGNMLWFSPAQSERKSLGGTLKIADFGQAELNCYMSKTKPRSVAHTVTYRPPEYDIPNAPISQVYDIWCLGCVYMEFVAWMLGGAKLVKRLSAQRLASDPSQNRSLTDTFFQVVDIVNFKREPKIEDFKVKDKVFQVSNAEI
jgi:serine/threonine protein kinase